MAGKSQPRTTHPPPEVPGAQWIPLTKGEFALVDDADYEMLSAYSWSLHYTKRSCKRSKYAATRIPGTGRPNKYVLMHRLLMPETNKVDHRDGDGLNNRRANLRQATNSQNAANVRLRTDNSTGYKGVVYRKAVGQWVASVAWKKQRYHLGYFDSPEAAARAYNDKALELQGEFATPNQVEPS